MNSKLENNNREKHFNWAIQGLQSCIFNDLCAVDKKSWVFCFSQSNNHDVCVRICFRCIVLSNEFMKKGWQFEIFHCVEKYWMYCMHCMYCMYCTYFKIVFLQEPREHPKIVPSNSLHLRLQSTLYHS